jgi:hypothetical protein
MWCSLSKKPLRMCNVQNLDKDKISSRNFIDLTPISTNNLNAEIN